MVRRCTQGDGDVIGHLVSGDRDHRRMMDGAVDEDRDVGGTSAYVSQADPQVLLVVGQHRLGRGQLLQHDVVDFQAAAAHALDDVLRGADRAGHHVYLGFQTHARHADGIADPLLIVDDELLRQDVQDLLIRRDGHGAGGIDDAVHVQLGHFVVANGDNAVGIEAADMATGDAGINRTDLAAGHQFGLFDRALYRLHRGFDVDHHALL